MRTPQSKGNWHLFNDFLVRPIAEEEALTFNTNWKLPSVIAYQIKDASNQIDDSWKQSLDTSILYIDTKYDVSEPSRNAYALIC
jgi:PAB-dependent poly(A)-specific ribonuclease subunit 2